MHIICSSSPLRDKERGETHVTMHKILSNGHITAFWKLPGSTLKAGARNALKQPSGSSLGLFSVLSAKLIQNCLLDAFWAHFLGWGPTCSKTAFWRLPSGVFWAGRRAKPKQHSGCPLCSLGIETHVNMHKICSPSL